METQTQVLFCEYCRIFQITCFEEHLPLATTIRCYLDTINVKQSGFYKTYYLSFKILVRDKLKNPESQKKKKKKKCNSHIYNVYVKH